ncbi:unnamed protein product [Lactuca virosa]|uniref:SWIM-type domain-containing protein n=1 Tax=Lactuca virosa TaxID=75947 RepID=A0AAU9M548_9ASTR|nr:unnamed protein product [Lactuca virosa]
MDFELHGIYMDHEPGQEFVSMLDKCKDHFLNIILCDVNIRNASMTDEVKDRVDHGNDLHEEADEVLVGMHSLGNVFEVRRAYANYKVDLEGRVCSCRLWDLSGIPRVHAIAAINYIHQTSEGYISEYFSMNKFKEFYSTNISPMNWSNMWPQTRYNKSFPPVGRKMLGRPRIKRRRHESEKESKFSSTSMVKPPRTISIPKPPKKIGRPRKSDVVGFNPHVSGSNQHASQPPVTSTIPTQPSQLASQQGSQHATKKASQQDSVHASSSNIGKKIRKLGLRGLSLRVGGITSMGRQFSEVTIPGVRRKNLGVRRPNLRKSTTKFQDVNNQVPAVNDDIPNDVAQALVVNDVTLVNEVIEEEVVEVSVKVAQEPVSMVNEVIEVKEAIDVPVKVTQDLKESLDEVRDEIDQIIGSRNASDASDIPLVNEGGTEPEFTEGHASDVLPDKFKISVKGIANLLEAGYSMAKIESMGRLEIELDDTSPLEMDLNEEDPDVDEGGGEFVNDVLNDEGEGVENQDDGDVIKGEGEGVNDRNEVDDDVLNNEADDNGNEAPDEGHLIVPKTRKRKPSESITKLKLKRHFLIKMGVISHVQMK